MFFSEDASKSDKTMKLKWWSKTKEKETGGHKSDKRMRERIPCKVCNENRKDIKIQL